MAEGACTNPALPPGTDLPPHSILTQKYPILPPARHPNVASQLLYQQERWLGLLSTMWLPVIDSLAQESVVASSNQVWGWKKLTFMLLVPVMFYPLLVCSLAMKLQNSKTITCSCAAMQIYTLGKCVAIRGNSTQKGIYSNIH